MTRNNLIDQIAETTQSGKKEAEQVVDAVLAQIAEALQNGEKVDLVASALFR